jgi:hypothetical protein
MPDRRVEGGDLRRHRIERGRQIVQARVGPLFDHLSHFCAS